MNLKLKKFLVIAGFICAILLIGFWIGRSSSSSDGESSTQSSEIADTAAKKITKTVWTCSMHPQIRLPKPGKCPICSMTLIPLKQDSSDSEGEGRAVLKLSKSAIKLAEIETSPVLRKLVEVKIRMVGKVAYNESLLAYITARMPGRIDKLFVNFTGIPVRKGDHMAEYYSPELLIGQRELLLSIKNIKNKKKDSYIGYGMSDEKVLETVKKKLELWGLTKKNIDTIIKNGKVKDHITLYSPIAGIVIQKQALEGEYFKTGDRLFTVADLSLVWVMLDAYELDLMWLRYGQTVEFTTVAYPGEVFKGKISFIDPVLDKKTRTVKIRVDADNSTGRLKPEMFVNAIVKAKVARAGKVVDPSLAGKWIGPMHPEIISDEPGKCPICDMSLVKAEALGYSNVGGNQQLPLVIPSSAPLITGKRAIVYIRSKKKPGMFYGKEVVLGPRAGNYYIVKSGLKKGDLVVTNGNFKIDSSLQILAKPSMMSADEEAPDDKTGKLTVSPGFLKQLNMVYNSYFAIRKALSEDDFKTAGEKIKYLGMMLGHISSDSLDEASTPVWNKIKREIKAMVKQGSKAENINDLRGTFSSLSAVIEELVIQFGTADTITVIKFKCPMAFDNKGAEWLQETDKIANPYLGKSMLGCGEKEEIISK